MTQLTDQETTELVLAERRGPVMVLTLNRPEAMNAWSYDLEDKYYELLDEAEADPDVRAIVLTGAGRGFCSGADMNDLQRVGELDGADLPERPRPRTYPLTVRKPLIAAINGAAVGLGLVEALFCDIRFASPKAKFSTAFARRGLVAEYGMAWLLPRLVGQSRAVDLLFSGRMVGAQEAATMGLINRVVDEGSDVLDEAVAYATELAVNSSPWSMSVIKTQVGQALDLPFSSSLEEADRLMNISFGRPDVIEGITSYIMKRPPAFDGLPPR